MEAINLIIENLDTSLRVLMFIYFFSIFTSEMGIDEVFEEAIDKETGREGGKIYKVFVFLISAIYDVIFCPKCLALWSSALAFLITGVKFTDAIFLGLINSFIIFVIQKKSK